MSLLNHLKTIIKDISKGDYESGKKLDRFMTDKQYSKEEMNLIDSIGFMGVKLEVRELQLKDKIEELSIQNKRLMEANKRNEIFSTLFVNLFLSISLYVFLVFTAISFDYYSQYSARIVELIFFTTCVIIIKKSKFSFAYFGVTLRDLGKSLRLALPGTIAICILLVALKYLCMVFNVEGLTGPLFLIENFNLLFWAYVPVVVLQEFLARGVIQTIIEYVLAGRHSAWWAIITASSLFGLVHIQLSVALALAAFVFSIYWGFIYHKCKTLVGVSISHLVIGNFAYLLGFWDFLEKLT